jgi:uncharacterized membrane protein
VNKGSWGRAFKNIDEERLASRLGWFSVGLGVAELAAPRQLANLIGVSERTALIRTMGMRELASGIGILATQRPAGWLWTRVAGDAMDLSLLGAALSPDNPKRGRAILATAAVASVTVLDFLCGQQLTLSPETGYRAIRVRKAIAVNRNPEEVYRFWRDFSNHPRFMKRLVSVTETGDRRSHWKAAGPGGRSIEWDAETTEDRPNEFIAWRSLRGSDIYNSGSVRFERVPANRGTIVRVQLDYAPPGGGLSAMIAKLAGADPGMQLEEDLRAFKQIVETGEVTKSDASIHAWIHEAQPPGSYQPERETTRWAP